METTLERLLSKLRAGGSTVTLTWTDESPAEWEAVWITEDGRHVGYGVDATSAVIAVMRHAG